MECMRVIMNCVTQGKCREIAAQRDQIKHDGTARYSAVMVGEIWVGYLKVNLGSWSVTVVTVVATKILPQ